MRTLSVLQHAGSDAMLHSVDGVVCESSRDLADVVKVDAKSVVAEKNMCEAGTWFRSWGNKSSSSCCNGPVKSPAATPLMHAWRCHG